MIEIKTHSKGVSFKIRVQPRASQNKIAGVHADALKIRLTAAPVEGAANNACLKYLAKCLKAPVSALTILSGHTSRTKRILWRSADGVSASKQKKALMAALAAAGLKTP
jgi:uncharacterized protein